MAEQSVARRILVTGASGFVGRAVVHRLIQDGVTSVSALYRNEPVNPPAGLCEYWVGDLEHERAWHDALAKIDVIVHCAALVHVASRGGESQIDNFRRVNVEGSCCLADAAIRSGCQRLVYVSTIKVNGEFTTDGHSFSEREAPAACDPYGLSKLEAERALLSRACSSSLEVVVIRPPLVYGPGVKANFRSMMHWLHTGVPLPFGAIANRRSLVALDNLVDLLVLCTWHPAAANQVFLAGDGEDVSTPELLRRTAGALGCPARLLPVPATWLRWAARLLGKAELVTRLCGSLQVDISKARSILGWTPPIGLNEGLRQAADDFLSRRRDE